MLTFVSHVKKDSEERVKNLNIVLPYYKSIMPVAKFIFVEDSPLQQFSYLSKLENVSYINIEETTPYNKSKCYNAGLSSCDTEYICFLDIDCIVSMDNINKSLETVCDETIAIGYNGTSIYFNKKVKEEIKSSDAGLYDFLDSYIEKDNIFLNYKNENYLVGNTKAVGGCLLGKTKTFKEVNGFNPNIIGWGYEDNEMVHRSNKLGHSPVYINTKKPLLFHLPHSIEECDKSDHPHYQNNYNEFAKVTSMNKVDLKEYIKKW